MNKKVLSESVVKGIRRRTRAKYSLRPVAGGLKNLSTTIEELGDVSSGIL